MKLTHLQLRKLFAQFWESKNHKEIPPIPLVPQNDSSTLFTGSGMQQLVPNLLGEPHPLGEKLYNIQPCLRAQDIDEIGDNRHTTFFEMMGNWSLGTYFKEEQLAWVWDFFTQVIKLPKEKLYVSVFKGSNDLPKDNESAEIWKKLGLSEDKIHYYDAKKNWWSRAGVPENMPAGEPGGPDSEIFYEFTKIKHDPKFGRKCHPNCDCGRFLEIGNSVFMQYKKVPGGTFQELPKKNVDFGGGLERILAAANDDPDVFKTDLFSRIVDRIESYTQRKYSDLNNQAAIRVITDHMKAAIFLIVNGVTPSNKEHGYVLRRILRRAAVKMFQLKGQVTPPEAFKTICEAVLTTYEIIVDNNKHQTHVIATVKEEMERFGKSLDRGLREIKKIEKIDGKIAFNFYQNFGFPLEITEELFKEKGQQIDRKQFYTEFEKHKNLSRTASAGMFKGGLADNSEQVLKYHTATHLLHQALFDVLGNDVRQEGSNITGERLRFDFSAPRKLTDEEKIKVQEIINDKVKESLAVSFKIIPKAEAYKIGARSFFREKYPDMVKVYSVGDYSKEFCGGPHVKNTKEIGKIEIFKYEKIGSNLYRVYAK